MNEKKASLPKEITSVMTSRALCSLPDDEMQNVIDYEKENHVPPFKKHNFTNTNEK